MKIPRELRDPQFWLIAALVIAAILIIVFLGIGAGYKRSDFKHWSDLDRDCKNTRAEILEAQADGPLTWNVQGCIVAAGTWADPYSGETFHSPAEVDVDHIIPLAAAWQRGARDWDRDKREQYANWEPGLLAVSARLNRQKGSRGPAEWLPPVMDRCGYVALWFMVAERWDLLVTVAEAEMLSECHQGL